MFSLCKTDEGKGFLVPSFFKMKGLFLMIADALGIWLKT